MAKIRKPMRLDEELITLVEEHGVGDNFTAKMEWILRDYFFTKKEREKELYELKAEIDNKSRKLSSYNDKIHRMKQVLSAATDIVKYIEGQRMFFDIDNSIDVIRDCIEKEKGDF